nr:NADH dehydrogenase subunit 2 [Lophiomys imhausi]
MNPLTLLIISLTIILGPMITMLSTNQIMMWIGLEMSLLGITPLLINKKNQRSIEAATKYFITQATASMLFLLSSIMNFGQLGMWTPQPQTHPMILSMLFVSLMIKLGMAPFHYWLPEVAQGTPLHINLILLTWQKIAPLSILYQIHPMLNTNLTFMAASLSVCMGAWGGLNQTQVRKIMAYSSISHMGWMMAILPLNPSLMTLNLTIYIMITTSAFIPMITNSLTSISSLSMTWNKSPMLLIPIPLVLLSLGGLPPLTGFMPKWAIITELLKNNNTTLATLMALTTLMNLFFYTRLIYSSSLTVFPTNNNLKMHYPHNNKKNLLLPISTTLSTLTLPLMPQMIL